MQENRRISRHPRPMRSEFSQRQDQRLAMTPAMLQSIEVLQLTTAELLDRIDAELARNETLAVAAPPPDDDTGPARARDRGAADAKHELLHQLVAPGPDLVEHLRLQLALLDVDPQSEASVMALVECLDECGYLTISESELAEQLGWDALMDARALLGSLEPRGLGANGPIDAMIAQLGPDDPDTETIERLLTDHLEDLARQRVPDVARALDLSEADVRSLLERVAVLDPRPGARFGERPAAAVRPELEVREQDGRLEVFVDEFVVPTLELDAHYASLATADDTAPAVRSYLRDKLRDATSLIRAVEQRQQTLVRVGAALFAEQVAFLRHGEAAIRPLRMADLAERLELHVSTVSRADRGQVRPHGPGRARAPRVLRRRSRGRRRGGQTRGARAHARPDRR